MSSQPSKGLGCLLHEGRGRRCGALDLRLNGLHGCWVGCNRLGRVHGGACLCKPDSVGNGLVGHTGGDDADCLGQHLNLTLAQSRSLIPSTCSVAAHVCECGQILFVLSQRRRHVCELCRMLLNVLNACLPLLLCFTKLCSLHLNQVLLILICLLVLRDALDLSCIDFVLLLAEVIQELLQGLNNVIRMELVVLHRHLRSLLEEGHSALNESSVADSKGICCHCCLLHGLNETWCGDLGGLQCLNGALQ
mmetsp:Transcript_48223/g.88824  ORF Transcript_48223/g.88824 Transcript_48223/m.88824 type:complete len:249 (+) Transcript_48223:1054-1800(+)